MSISTAVLRWGDPDDPDDPIDPIDPDDPDDLPLTEVELNAPFKIDVVPAQPLISQQFYLEIYAHDARRWRTRHYGAGGGTILHFTIENGANKSEVAQLNGSSGISVAYPVGSVSRIVCTNGLFNADTRRYRVTPGSILSPSLYSVINGEIVFDNEANYYGVLNIEYITTRYRKQHISHLYTGTHYLDCYVNNTSRRQIITINIGDNEAAVQTVTIKDYCTDEVIPGARVVIAGQTLTADANGTVVLNGIGSGQTLPVVITASGYHDSDADTLNNDTITT